MMKAKTSEILLAKEACSCITTLIGKASRMTSVSRFVARCATKKTLRLMQVPGV